MKKTIRNAFILGADTLGFSALVRQRARSRGPLVRIISFHDLTDSVWFTDLIATLARDFHLITPDEFHRQAFDAEKINLLLSFDDGYQSWVDTALPVLGQHGAKGLFFVNSGLLDAATDSAATNTFMRDRLLLRHRVPLSWEGAAKLVVAGHTIGGHTRSHPRLSHLDESQLSAEILADKTAIESHLGMTLLDFAYPFGTKGDYTPAALAACQTAGYEYIYTADPGFYQQTPQEIPRTLLEEGQPPQSAHRWIIGGYDVFYQCKQMLGK